MDLRRTNLIMEFGSYGPTGSGGNGSAGLSAPIGVRNFATYPFMPNMELLKQKDAEANRRRERLRQLALGWFFTSGSPDGGRPSGAPGDSNASLAGGSAGAGPGRLF